MPSISLVVIKSLLLFVLAGLCEIGGGYLVWLWVREGKGGWGVIVGSLLLIVYGFVATLQPANFGRVYVAYGGIFIVLSWLWGWKIDGNRGDVYDAIGVVVILLGMAIMMYAPRT